MLPYWILSEAMTVNEAYPSMTNPKQTYVWPAMYGDVVAGTSTVEWMIPDKTVKQPHSTARWWMHMHTQWFCVRSSSDLLCDGEFECASIVNTNSPFDFKYTFSGVCVVARVITCFVYGNKWNIPGVLYFGHKIFQSNTKPMLTYRRFHKGEMCMKYLLYVQWSSAGAMVTQLLLHTFQWTAHSLK